MICNLWIFANGIAIKPYILNVIRHKTSKKTPYVEKLKGYNPIFMCWALNASTIQVYDCGNPRERQCAGRLSLQVVSHLSLTCIYVVYIYSVLFLLFYIIHRKKKSFLFLPNGRAFVTMTNVRNIKISDGCVYAQIHKGLGMHLVTYTVPFLLLVQYKGGLSEIEFTVSLFSNAGMILLSFLKISCISLYIKGGIAHFC